MSEVRASTVDLSVIVHLSKKTFAQLSFLVNSGHYEEQSDVAILWIIKYVLRLLRFARNDNAGVMQRSP